MMNLLALLVTQLALASASPTEIPLLKAFVPAQGYDSNDNTEVVLDGELPSPCFTLGAPKVDSLENGVYRVRQIAWPRTDGACGSGDLNDTPVPFTTSISLGRLEPGSYAIDYSTQRGHVQRPFQVAQANFATQDDYPYAALTGLTVPEVVREGEHAVIELRGVHVSTCDRKTIEVRVKHIDDVFVVLPIQRQDEARPSAECRPTKVPFKKTVDLGPVPRGHYLVHARSMNGKAIFQSFFSYHEGPR